MSLLQSHDLIWSSPDYSRLPYTCSVAIPVAAANTIRSHSSPVGIKAETETDPAVVQKNSTSPSEASNSPREQIAVNGNRHIADRALPSDHSDGVSQASHATPTARATSKSPDPQRGLERDEETKASNVAASPRTIVETKKEVEINEESAEPAGRPSTPPEDPSRTDPVSADTGAESDLDRSREKSDSESADPTLKSPDPDTDMPDAAPDVAVDGGVEKSAEALDADPPSTNSAPDHTPQPDQGSAEADHAAKSEASPTLTSIEVSMGDAPALKVARQRDDDTPEAPAPKRARTDSRDNDETETMATDGAQGPPAEATAVETETPGLDLSAITGLGQWSDTETNARPISVYQRREIRKVIGRVKKTKSGMNFRDSVHKLWPQLWEGYMAKIDKPMDLTEIDRNLRDPNGLYTTLGDFKADLALIFENSLSFNGTSHDITFSAATVVRNVWEDVLPIPTEEPARPKAVPKPKPVRESRATANAEAAARRQAAAPPQSPLAEAPSAPAPAPQEQHVDRRSSTATDGDRPKRTVRAPKPKDIDYTTKPSRKKLKPEMQFCDEVLSEVMHPKNVELNTWFMEPVDAEGLNIPDYYSIIKKPMDLGKVHRLLSSGEFSSLKEFDKTIRLIFDNCFKFNGPPDQGNPVSKIAKQLEDVYLSLMKGKDAWLAKHAKANAPPTSVSNASDDEGGEDEAEPAADAATDNKEIEELQAKLDEETKKLNGMLVGGNQSLIEIQKGIVDMVQNALIKAAQSVQQSRPKNEKSAKKAGKGGKSKASGASSGGRKSTGGANSAKKSSGPKRAAPKKTLTAAEKDQIANAINDLEYPHLDRAIDIIKRDTGQNVSGVYLSCLEGMVYAD